jgi:hypothetical protein
MKWNLIFIAAAMILSQAANAQQQTGIGEFSGIRITQRADPTSNFLFFKDSTQTGEYYLQKSKNQKTAAWIILGGGIALSFVGIVGVSANYNIFEETSTQDTYAAITLVGTGLALGSIPLFIASGRNHRKAATFSFKNERIYIPQQNSFVLKSQPALSLVIPL